MLPATLTPRRKLALALALPPLFISYGVLFYAMHKRADPASLLLRLPFVGTVALTIAFALSGGVLLVELARLGIPGSTAWSEKRHFVTVLIVAAVSFAGQWFCLVLAAQRGARAF
jgi:hypothetical protein